MWIGLCTGVTWNYDSRNVSPDTGSKISDAGRRLQEPLPRPHSEPPNHRGGPPSRAPRGASNPPGGEVKPKKIKVEYLGSTPVDQGSTDLGSLQVGNTYLFLIF